MRKILCLSCLFCQPAMAHGGAVTFGGKVAFIFFFVSLTFFILLFSLLFMFRKLYLLLDKSDKEKDSAKVFAFYKTNTILSVVAVIGTFIFISAFKIGITDISEIMDFLGALAICSLGFAPFYLILFIIYGIILAINRIKKKNR